MRSLVLHSSQHQDPHSHQNKKQIIPENLPDIASPTVSRFPRAINPRLQDQRAPRTGSGSELGSAGDAVCQMPIERKWLWSGRRPGEADDQLKNSARHRECSGSSQARLPQ